MKTTKMAKAPKATKAAQRRPALVLGEPDFRMYAAEVVQGAKGELVRMQLCEELVEGRWEPFYAMSKV